MTKFLEFTPALFNSPDDDNGGLDVIVHYAEGIGQNNKTVTNRQERFGTIINPGGNLAPQVYDKKEGPFFCHPAFEGYPISNANAEFAGFYAYDFDLGDYEGFMKACDALANMGVTAYAYTSWSHGKTESSIGAEAILRDIYKTGKSVTDVVKSKVKDKFHTSIWESIEAEDETFAFLDERNQRQVHFRYHHDPMPKYRLFIPPVEPFPLEIPPSMEHGIVTRRDRANTYKNNYIRFAAYMGFVDIIDKSVHNPGRIFYKPNFPPNTPRLDDNIFESSEHRGVGVIHGAPLDVDKVLSRQFVVPNMDDMEVGSGGEASHGRTDTLKSLVTDGLREAVFDPEFDILSLVREQMDDAIKSDHGSKLFIICPHEDEHSEPNPTATMIEARDGEGWTAVCLSDGCRSARLANADGEFDRLILMDKLCQEHGVSSVREYLSKTQEAEDEKAGLEGMILRVPMGAYPDDAADVIEAIAARPEIEHDRWIHQLNARMMGKKKTELTKLVKAAKRALPQEERETYKVERKDDIYYIDGTTGFADKVAQLEHYMLDNAKADPFVFAHRGRKNFVAITRNEHTGEAITTDLAGTSDRVEWMTPRVSEVVTDKEGNQREVAIEARAVQAVFRKDSFRFGAPILQRMVDLPVFTAQGTLRTDPGYDPIGETYFAPAIDYYPVAENPTEEELDEAWGFLVYELFRDSPFSDEVGEPDLLPLYTKEKDEDGWPIPNLERGRGSRMAMIALMLTPIARELYSGVTPWAHFDKPVAGTGASVCLQAFHMTIMGKPFPAVAFPTTEEEMAKIFLPLIRSGRPIIAFDNLNHKSKIDSPLLAGILTSEEFEGRTLAKSETAEGDNRAVLVTTGNNIRATPEMLRRTFPIYLNAQMADPRNRDAKYEMKQFCQLHRAKIVWCLHILIQNWVAKGMKPYYDKKIGSFEGWSQVIGGILRDAGVNMDHWLQVYERYYSAKAVDGFDPKIVIEWFRDHIVSKSEFADGFSGRALRGEVFLHGDPREGYMDEAFDIEEWPIDKNKPKEAAIDEALNELKGTYRLDDGTQWTFWRETGDKRRWRLTQDKLE